MTAIGVEIEKDETLSNLCMSTAAALENQVSLLHNGQNTKRYSVLLYENEGQRLQCHIFEEILTRVQAYHKVSERHIVFIGN